MYKTLIKYYFCIIHDLNINYLYVYVYRAIVILYIFFFFYNVQNKKHVIG